MLIAEIILPLPVKSNFDYRVPAEVAEEAVAGKRALVVFGKRKIYTGVIRRVYEESNLNRVEGLKELDELLDDVPVLTEKQLAFFDWIAHYYFCTPGEVLKASLPTGMKLESTLRVEKVAGVDWESLDLPNKEWDLMDLLSHHHDLGLQEVSELWGVENPSSRLKNMESRGLIRLIQRVDQAYKAKFEKYLELDELFRTDEALNQAFASLSRAPKQEDALMLVVQAFLKGNAISRADLLAKLDGGQSAVKALLDKGILREIEVQVDRLEGLKYDFNKKDIILNEEQMAALNGIRQSFLNFPGKPVLLHGVTGSGKTHLYIELIREKLAENKQVLYLLPEISLTKQIIDKVKSEFGEIVGVYHSRFNDNERVEIWHKVLRREYQIVIGVRSAIFLPFPELGLIVVDEEHDNSLKQVEPNPRYHARDLSVYAPRVFDCQVLLGSATPSFETYTNALEGRYTLVEIRERAVKAVLPEIILVDMREQRKKKLLEGDFSKPLVEAIKNMHSRREQGIIFLNRRGFAPYLICTTCGHVPHCINCDITLTFHKSKKEIRCHYCGYSDYQTEKCDQCGNFTYKRQGVGTEKVEEELHEIFPDLRIARMDLDTTRSKFAFQQLIHSFEKQEIDLLVGTQMVTKGLDFPNVTLVGVVMADNLLNFPDFRAYERAYQLLTQVSGRAGRSHKKGKVMIQTSMPENPVLNVLQAPFVNFYNLELPQRNALNFPPFSRLIRIELKNKDRVFLEEETIAFYRLLAPVFGKHLLGPEYPLISRLRNEYRMQFLLKLPRSFSVNKVRSALSELIDTYYTRAPKKTLRIMVDVDPTGAF
ncbi:MAG: primosomal protein N' [Bacteroidia bacterium]|nr:primosomal protein N' [Bacteroidia bacterium]